MHRRLTSSVRFGDRFDVAANVLREPIGCGIRQELVKACLAIRLFGSFAIAYCLEPLLLLSTYRAVVHVNSQLI
ncbi:hypothetical protein B9Y56_22335 [Stenotrophomonas maltophilia]|nr:hypothetical protein B9Y56_22335 [Stenotrophomonas maltophilia]